MPSNSSSFFLFSLSDSYFLTEFLPAIAKGKAGSTKLPELLSLGPTVALGSSVSSTPMRMVYGTSLVFLLENLGRGDPFSGL